MTTRVKICGITSIEDAELCLYEGADAIGLNFWPRSPRCIGVEQARRLVEVISARTLVVGVFVDADYVTIDALKHRIGLHCIQLHGDEPPELLERFLPHAYKALRVRSEGSIAEAMNYGGEHILLDAYDPGQPGGTGKTFRWELATELARMRKLTLAGGLNPRNVAQAVTTVRPYCVDVASGVERSPGVKDPIKVRDFIAAAKLA